MIKLQITYERVTPESAEHGECSDHGFYEHGGWFYSIADADFETRCKAVGRDQALADNRPDPVEFATIYEAIEFLEGYAPFEPSSAPGLDSSTWLTEVNGSEDYLTGEATRLSFHLECDNPADHVAILRAVLGSDEKN